MTPKLLALLCLTVGLLVVVPSAQAQSAEMWVYAGLTADASQVFGYAEADLSYPSCACTGWWDHDSCCLDYDIYVQATLSHAGSTVDSYSWEEYCSGVWMTVSETNPSPGTWDWNVGVSASVDWLQFYYMYSQPYYRSNYLWGGGTYTASVSGGGGDPNPVITWIWPDTWDAGTTFQVAIGGSGFGDAATVDAGPYVSVSVEHPNWDDQINATVTVSPDAPSGQQNVTVTSNGWGGMGWMPMPGQGQQTPASGTVTLRRPPASNCGDPLMSALVDEYLNPLYGQTWVPDCADIVTPVGSANFSVTEINQDNDYRNNWTITRQSLLTGLEDVRAAAGSQPMWLTSGYRNPVYQYWRTATHVNLNSRHTRGDAADVTEMNTERWNRFKSTLGPQYGACVEPLDQTDGWVHFDWRGLSICPPDGGW